MVGPVVGAVAVVPAVMVADVGGPVVGTVAPGVVVAGVVPGGVVRAVAGVGRAGNAEGENAGEG